MKNYEFNRKMKIIQRHQMRKHQEGYRMTRKIGPNGLMMDGTPVCVYQGCVWPFYELMPKKEVQQEKLPF